MNKKILSGLAAMLLCGAAFAAEPGEEPKPADTSVQPNTRPDNTAVNKRDRNSNEKTADSQNNNSADLQITQKIRREIVADKSLSTYAHNVKIITQNGNVTLKGPVKDADEKSRIENKAIETAGKGNVTSELEVLTAR